MLSLKKKYTNKNLFKCIAFVFIYIFSPVLIISIMVCALIARFNKLGGHRTRLFFGDEPLINFSYYKKSIEEEYPNSKSFVSWVMPINDRQDWDLLLREKFWYIPKIFDKYYAFCYCLIKFDIFFTGCNGIFIGKLPISTWQKAFLVIAGKKIVVLPYGSDAYVYRRVHSAKVLHSLQTSYPEFARNSKLTQRNTDYWVRHADVFIPSIMGADGFGRWDILIPSHLFIDTDNWKPRVATRFDAPEVIKIAHSPNHRGVKGTEFLIDAIERLQSEGYSVELILIEGRSNSEVLEVLTSEAHILVEQLNGYGYAMSGLEGMASGIPVITSPQHCELIDLLRTHSFFNECPVVASSPENIYRDLKSLVNQPQMMKRLGEAGRTYAIKYHSYQASKIFIKTIIDKLNKPSEDIINFYHPIIGQYESEIPKIETGLNQNKLNDDH